MTNFARLLNTLTDMYAGDRNAYIDSFKRYELLIIDDLGMERNSEFQSEIGGIYPCGEGAGYAGGITSAAMDGLRIAEAIRKHYRPNEFTDK